MLTVHKETFGMGIKYKNNNGVVEDIHFQDCRFTEQFEGNTFKGCIFEECTLPQSFEQKNTLLDCIH